MTLTQRVTIAPPATCRVGGCAAPATGTLGLCEGHAAGQKRRRAAAEQEQGPARSGRDLAAAFDALADVVAARDESWRALTACRGRTAVMFPTAPDRRPVDFGPAVELCARCPVVEPCREAGAREPAGVWGGSTPADRGFTGRRRRST